VADRLVSESRMFQRVLAGGRLAHRLKHTSKRKKTKYFLGKELRKCCYISKRFCHSNPVQVFGGGFNVKCLSQAL